MKQTAVEWLLDCLSNYDSEMIELFNYETNRAKEMEEQNTIEILERYHNSLFNIPLKEGEAKEILKHLKK